MTGCAALLAACGVNPPGPAKSSPIAAITTVIPSTTTTTTVPLVRYHVIQGDTLTAIASRFGVSVAAIVAANHLANPDQLIAGLVLTIPPAPPPQLVVTPSEGRAGATFELELIGARPSEVVIFEVDSPGGGKFTGPPHTVQPDGTVSTSYVTMPGDAAGMYSAQATGARGTVARAGFRVDTVAYSP